jgi:hypothetical protein
MFVFGLTTLAVTGVVALLLVPTGGRSARAARPHACERTTFGRVTFDLLATGVRCDVAIAVVESFQERGTAPSGWSCASLVCWRGARTYERAHTRLAELVDLTVEPGPTSPGRCESGGVAITARQYIACAAARRALALYLGHRPGRRLISCNGDARTGGFCAVTFASGAQGRFAYGPEGRS